MLDLLSAPEAKIQKEWYLKDISKAQLLPHNIAALLKSKLKYPIVQVATIVGLKRQKRVANHDARPWPDYTSGERSGVTPVLVPRRASRNTPRVGVDFDSWHLQGALDVTRVRMMT